MKSTVATLYLDFSLPDLDFNLVHGKYEPWDCLESDLRNAAESAAFQTQNLGLEMGRKNIMLESTNCK